MSYIFVGGAPRTGTTLMQILLCQGAGTNPYVREAAYLRRLVQIYADVKSDASYSLEDYFDSVEDLRTLHASFIRGALEHVQARFPGTTHLVLKEPTLTKYFPELDELLGSEARFICMARDPRDTICSMLTVAGRQEAGGFLDAATAIPGDQLKTLCAYYREFYLPLLNGLHPELLDRTLFVKYEDLVQRPDTVIGALEHQLGIDLARARDGRALDTGRVDFSDPVNQISPWRSDLYGKAVSTARVGVYRTKLTPDEIGFIERDLADFFRVFRFETDQRAA